MNFKVRTFLLACLLLSTTSTIPGFSQDTSIKQDDFNKGRDQDFTKLVGGIQEGIRLEYNNEKTNLGYSQAKKLAGSLMVQGAFSVGTTSNLSTLFSQDVLPAFAVSGTVHKLIRNWSIWFYDGEFTTNGGNFKNNGASPDSFVSSSPNEFTYRDRVWAKVTKGELTPGRDSLYTVRSFWWLSGTVKYDYSKYAFYDTARVFSLEVYDERYGAGSAKASLNYFINWNHDDIKWRWWKPRFVFATVGLQRLRNNNIQQLKKDQINDVKFQTVNGSTIRQYTETASAYGGIYREYGSIAPQFEFLYSPLKALAINFFGEYNIIDKSDRDRLKVENYAAVAAGLYFYNSNEKSKINVGVFYKWVEDPLANSWDGTINLKTSIPIVPF
jgi:hypothetical protein